MVEEDDDLAGVLDAVGPRLREIRQRRNLTLTKVGELTGISLSTLSRLESGQRKPTLELLLPLAKAYDVPLDDLVGAPPTGDPRVRMQPYNRHGMTYIPLTRHLGGLQAYKLILPGRTDDSMPEPRVHEGYEWLYVLSGALRMRLGEHEFVLAAGEAAEFDTRTPHGWRSAGPQPVEFLSIFGSQGERMHLRARPARK